MKLEGHADLSGSPAEVFERLLDPGVLRRCLPGCRSLRAVPGSEHEYQVLVEAGVGPVRGTFQGLVTLHDLVPPERYAMTVAGHGTIGHVSGGAEIRLEALDGGGTRVAYSGEGKVSGLLARVGGRLLDLAARKVADEFFTRLAREA